MGRIEDYREILRKQRDVEKYLLEESRLPGPRANLELAFAYAVEGDTYQFIEYASLDPEQAPQNTEREFLAFSGTLGLGYRLSEHSEFLQTLRESASDPRWRIREAVALGLQRWGTNYPDEILKVASEWSKGSSYEKRAAIAAICEPELLEKIEPVSRVFDLLDSITSFIKGTKVRDEGFNALRKSLGYCWSVAVSAHPVIGKPRMERWIGCIDRDVRWVMKQNLQKKRLIRLDSVWVSAQRRRLDA